MLKKGEIYKLDEPFWARLGAAHGYLWVYEGRYNLAWRQPTAFLHTRGFISQFADIQLAENVVAIKGERKWGKFRSLATGHAMEMPTFAVVAREENLMRKILRRIEWLSS